MCATDVSAVNDIVVDGESGYILAMNDLKQLAERIGELLSNPEKAREMGREAFKRASTLCDFRTNTENLVVTWKTMVGVDS